MPITYLGKFTARLDKFWVHHNRVPFNLVLVACHRWNRLPTELKLMRSLTATFRCHLKSSFSHCVLTMYVMHLQPSTTACRQHLRSAAGHQLVIPSHRLTKCGRRAFSVAGLMFWNLLPRNLCDPSYTAAVFGRSLKTFLFSEY